MKHVPILCLCLSTPAFAEDFASRVAETKKASSTSQARKYDQWLGPASGAAIRAQTSAEGCCLGARHARRWASRDLYAIGNQPPVSVRAGTEVLGVTQETRLQSSHNVAAGASCSFVALLNPMGLRSRSSLHLNATPQTRKVGGSDEKNQGDEKRSTRLHGWAALRIRSGHWSVHADSCRGRGNR